MQSGVVAIETICPITPKWHYPVLCKKNLPNLCFYFYLIDYHHLFDYEYNLFWSPRVLRDMTEIQITKMKTGQRNQSKWETWVKWSLGHLSRHVRRYRLTVKFRHVSLTSSRSKRRGDRPILLIHCVQNKILAFAHEEGNSLGSHVWGTVVHSEKHPPHYG